MKRLFGAEYEPIKFGMKISVLILTIVFPISLLFPETFPDFIIEGVSIGFCNKTWELRGIWLALFAGCAGMLLRFWRQKELLEEEPGTGFLLGRFKLLTIVFMVMPILFCSAFFGAVSAIFLHVLLLVLVLVLCTYSKHFFLSETLAKKIVLLFIVTYYFALALVAVINVFHILNGVGAPTIEGIAFLLSGFCVYRAWEKRDFVILDRAIAFFQIFIPLNLCIFLVDRYLYENSIVTIPWESSYILFYLALMLLLMLFALNKFGNIRKSSEVEENVSQLISLPLLITVFLIHAYQPPSYIWWADMWHLGDSMLAWQQGIKQGLTFYQEYSPNSGLFGMLSSFLQCYFFPSGALSFNGSTSLEYTLFAILAAVLLNVHFDKAIVLLVGSLFVMPSYNRVLLILPVMLILMIPWLLRHRLYWLCCWTLLGILSFLYYPLNGAAIVGGTFPLFFYQVYCLLKSRGRDDSFACKYKRLVSIVLCAATIVAVIIFAPLMYRLLAYVVSMSGQTIWADGLTVFPNEIDSHFFPWAGRGRLIILLYDIFEFGILIFAVMLPLWYIMRKMKTRTFAEMLGDTSTFLFLAVIIGLVVNYQFAFIRMDPGSFLARANPFLYIVFMLLLPWAIFLSEKVRRFDIHLIHIGMLIGLGTMLIAPSFGNEIKVMPVAYLVPEGYIYTEGVPGVDLGKGFVRKKYYHDILQARNDTEKLLKADEPLLEISFRQNFYFLLDKKAAVPSAGTYVVASLATQRANIAAMNQMPPKLVMYDADYVFRGLRDYYLTNWLLSHHYIFYENNNLSYYIHPERYASVFGNSEEAFQTMKSLPAKYFVPPMKGTPASWGNSMGTLKQRLQQISSYSGDDLNIKVSGHGLSSCEAGYLVHDGEGALDIPLPEGINGEDADFLYLDIEPILQKDKVAKKIYWKAKLYEAFGGINRYSGEVKLFWKTELQDFSETQVITCDYINGKLLIPANLVPSWRFANITGLRIALAGIPKDTILHVNKVAFYKVNQKE